jgi:hypothetical protein
MTVCIKTLTYLNPQISVRFHFYPGGKGCHIGAEIKRKACGSCLVPFAKFNYGAGFCKCPSCKQACCLKMSHVKSLAMTASYVLARYCPAIEIPGSNMTSFLTCMLRMEVHSAFLYQQDGKLYDDFTLLFMQF